MYQRSEEDDAIIQAIVGLLRSRERGSVILHEDIEAACGLSRSIHKQTYYRRVMSARYFLRDNDGVWSAPVHGVGVQLLTNRDTLVDEQQNRFKRAGRQIGKGRAAAVKLPDDQLTIHERRLKEVAVQQADSVRRELRGIRERIDETNQTYSKHPRREWVQVESRAVKDVKAIRA